MSILNKTRIALALCCSLAAGTALADDGEFRCGGQLIQVGMSMDQVQQLCGDPTSKAVETQNVHSGNRVTGTTEVQRWTYSSYSDTTVLVFDAGTLQSIE